MWTPAVTAVAGVHANMAVAAPDDQVITGTVEDAAGPMIGATVKVVGSSVGAVTDLDGKFSLKCKPGDMLEVSYVGYNAIQVKAKQGMKIVMSEDKTQLSEVVVTALGIKRERKALGYALSEVKGEDLQKAKETNVINSLAGKVAGLVVQNTASGSSGSTRVLLRGNTEITGDNQPLYVVDGVPLDNTNFGSAGTAGGYDLGDGISAINPDDIENMTVLKGPAASALYGSRASHGVILITTKKAEKDKVGLEYNGSLTFDVQNAMWDDIQQTYGMGYKGMFSKTATSGTNSSWGPKADNLPVEYFDGEVRPFQMYKDNISNFFRTGLTAQNTAILSVNSGKTGVRFSFTDMRNKDILPKTHMFRDNFNLRVNTSAGPVDFDFTANYTHENVTNRPALGDSQSNVGKNLMTLAGTYNQEWLQHYQNADGTYANWNGNDQYNINPYWSLYKNGNKSKKDIFRFTAKAIYNIDQHLKIQGTIGTDLNKMTFDDYIAKTTPGNNAGTMTKVFGSSDIGSYASNWTAINNYVQLAKSTNGATPRVKCMTFYSATAGCCCFFYNCVGFSNEDFKNVSFTFNSAKTTMTMINGYAYNEKQYVDELGRGTGVIYSGSKYGLTFSGETMDHTYTCFLTQKPIPSTWGTTYTEANFLTGSFNRYKIQLKSSSGLVVYTPNIGIFLGGYYTQLKNPIAIVLEPSATNYIYLERNQETLELVGFASKKKMIGDGAKVFNRICIAKIITNSDDVISIEYYKINIGYNDYAV